MQERPKNLGSASGGGRSYSLDRGSYDTLVVAETDRDAHRRRNSAITGNAWKMEEISAWLRKEREFSFFGDIDFILTERYTAEDAQKAIEDA